MRKECGKLGDQERRLLASLKGRTLDGLDACLVSGSSAWGGVRLHADGASVDVNAGLALAAWGPSEDDVDEFGCMSVTEGEPETLEVRQASPQTTVRPVGKTVTGVAVVDQAVDLHERGQWAARVETTQAVALQLGDEWLLLDRECWFSDMIAIKSGPDLPSLLYDDAPNWEVDPDERPNDRFVVSVTVTEL